jgi:quercetin dioxygenase-like cupin family protein
MHERRSTSFGWLEVWAEEAGGVPVVERLHFERNGRSHVHDRWEHVRVLDGEGVIVVGAERIAVVAGDAVSIPPGVAHWMETGFGLDIVLLYGEKN